MKKIDLKKYKINSKQFFEKRIKFKDNPIFDLRNVEAFKTSHLPGSQSLPILHLENNLNSLPLIGNIMFYGEDYNDTTFAANLLYNNGFDTFYFIDSYQSLIEGVDQSFLKINKKTQNYLLLQLKNKSSIYLSINPKTDFKAKYNIQIIKFSDITSDHIPIIFKHFKRCSRK